MKRVMRVAFPEYMDLVELVRVGIVELCIVAVAGRDEVGLNKEPRQIDRLLEVERIVGLRGRYEVVYSYLVA